MQQTSSTAYAAVSDGKVQVVASPKLVRILNKLYREFKVPAGVDWHRIEWGGERPHIPPDVADQIVAAKSAEIEKAGRCILAIGQFTIAVLPVMQPPVANPFSDEVNRARDTYRVGSEIPVAIGRMFPTEFVGYFMHPLSGARPAAP